MGGVVYHVLNRGNGRAEVFHKKQDSIAFLDLMAQAQERLRMRLLAWCLMPNHFHLVLWPHEDGALSRWMQWLMTSHVRRYHRHYHGSGHVWQGRFKAFPIEEDEHLWTAPRYVERNALRANLVTRAEDWLWSSAAALGGGRRAGMSHPGPLPRSKDWLDWVNRPQSEAELAALRKCIERGTPYGKESWQHAMAERSGLEASLHPRGRPAKSHKKNVPFCSLERRFPSDYDVARPQRGLVCAEPGDVAMAALESGRELLRRWRQGEQTAAGELYGRYAERLWRLAERQLSDRLRRRVGPDDILQSVFRTFFARAANGEYSIAHTGALWYLLVRITFNKVRRQAEIHGADKRSIHREVHGEDADLALAGFPDVPSQEEVDSLLGELETLVTQLSPREAEIVGWISEGVSVSETAARVGCSRWTVRRTLDRVGVLLTEGKEDGLDAVT